MKQSIAGVMRYDLLARHHFLTLDREQQAQAIHRLAALGQGDHTIAAATGLSVEMIRRVLSEREAQR